MLRISARVVIAMLIGSVFLFAMAVAYAVDLFDRPERLVRNGTTSGSPEYWQRIHFTDRAT
jgi:hypothetical protein